MMFWWSTNSSRYRGSTKLDSTKFGNTYVHLKSRLVLLAAVLPHVSQLARKECSSFKHLSILIIQGLPIAWKRIEELTWKVQTFCRDFPLKLWFAKTKRENEEGSVNPIISLKTFLQRVIDVDRLSDLCWNSEIRAVEFEGRFLFLVHKFPFNQFSQAQILLLILHPRPVKAPLSQLPPLLLLFHSTSRLDFLFFTASCSSKRLE
jgi:hypothetical protein